MVAGTDPQPGGRRLSAERLYTARRLTGQVWLRQRFRASAPLPLNVVGTRSTVPHSCGAKLRTRGNASLPGSRGTRRVDVWRILFAAKRGEAEPVSNQDACVCQKDVVYWWARSWSRVGGGKRGCQPLCRSGATCRSTRFAEWHS